MVSLAAVLLLAAPQTGGALPNHVKALTAADQLSATYSVTKVGGATEKFTVQLSKPNKARIDTPSRLIVADGTTITTYIKADKVFVKKAQTTDELKSAFDDKSLKLWLPFFDAEALKGVTAKDGADKRGMSTATAAFEGTTATFFTDKADKVIRQVQFDEKVRDKVETSILNAQAVALKGNTEALFAFTPPAGAQEVNESDLLEAKWLKFEDALAAAAKSKKIIMVDFMADWCGPCKMMDKEVFSTGAFKDAVKGMLLTKVDVDRETATAQRYGVEAMPTVKFLKSDGTVLHEFVGYGGPAQVLGEIRKARQMAGI